jgi:sulfite exporter TauE/SafE
MYLLLGVSAGAAGAGMDALGTSLGLERAAAAVMGFSLIAAGIAAFFRLRALQEPPLVSARSLHRERPETPGLIARFRKALAMMAAPGTFMGGAALGAASAFLPCGWLWSFVLVAAGTGSAGGGMATMFALWLGSLPALLAAGWLATQLLSRAGKHAPWIAASLLVAMGLLSLYERWPTERDSEAAAAPPCHAHAGVEG